MRNWDDTLGCVRKFTPGRKLIVISRLQLYKSNSNKNSKASIWHFCSKSWWIDNNLELFVCSTRDVFLCPVDVISSMNRFRVQDKREEKEQNENGHAII